MGECIWSVIRIYLSCDEMLSPDKVQEGHGVVWHAAALRPPGEVVLQHEPLRVSPLHLLAGGAALELRVTDLERPDRVVGEDVFSQLRYLNGTVALRIPTAGPVLITFLLQVVMP